MAGEVVLNGQVYVIPLADGSGSWVLVPDEFGDVIACQVTQPTETEEVVEEEPASKAPAAATAVGALMLLAGLL